MLCSRTPQNPESADRSLTLISLRIAYPPSQNAIWRAYKGRMILSESYRLWLNLSASEIMLGMRGQKPVKGPYAMTVRLDRPDRRRRDLSNVGTKCLEDSMVKAGVIEDDSLAQKITLEWTGSIGKPAFAYVEIEEWSEIEDSPSANVVQMRPSVSAGGVS